MTRVLVVGARGFLGAHVAEAARADSAVSAVLVPGRDELDLQDRAERVADVLDRLAPDAVVLCTGRLDGTWTELTTAHVGAAATLVDALVLLGRVCRVVRLGSAGEYGPVPFGRSVTEDDPTLPVTAYGASHLSATHLLRVAAAEGLVSGTTLRVFNPVGAGSRGPTLVGEVAARVHEALLLGSRTISTGPLTTWRDVVDAKDVALAAVATAVAPGPLPPVVNVGSGHAVSSRQLVGALAEVAGWTGQVVEDRPAPSRSAGVGWMQADVDLARRTLGWTPRRSLVESLRDVWDTTATDAITPHPQLTKEAS